jgi:NADH-quinone oxidoreductase subunit C
MTAQDIYTRLQETFGSDIVDIQPEGTNPFVQVTAGALLRICTYLKETPELDFNHLMCLSSVDYGDHLGVVYHLDSMWNNIQLCIKVEVPREQPEVESVTPLWKTADWHEREAFDMMGIRFSNHPDLRRILCPDDWDGYPLRKDYQVQEYYHDIRVPYPGNHADDRP